MSPDENWKYNAELSVYKACLYLFRVVLGGLNLMKPPDLSEFCNWGSNPPRLPGGVVVWSTRTSPAGRLLPDWSTHRVIQPISCHAIPPTFASVFITESIQLPFLFLNQFELNSRKQEQNVFVKNKVQGVSQKLGHQ